MIDVKELLRRWSAGQSERKIARDAGVSRGAVTRYLAAAKAVGFSRGDEPDEPQVQAVAKEVQVRTAHMRSEEWNEVAQHREAIARWLRGAGETRALRLTKVHTLLRRDYGLKASYYTLRRFAQQELGWRKVAPTVRLDDPPPGQEAQVDFGQMGLIWDEESGRQRMIWVLVVTLCFSRYQFVWPTFSQTTAAVCEGLDRAWAFFQAMVHILIPDNTPAMVKKTDRLEPCLVPAFQDYTQERGLFVDPARVRRPRDKARVENQVPYVRESWFAGERFTGLDDAQRHAADWCAETAGRRVHGTTQKVPREVFETVERATMLPPPKELFDAPLWVEAAKVHADNHVQIARALYSVPIHLRGQTVRARADQKVVKIYAGHELIRVHTRQPPGGRSTDAADYPKGKEEYATRTSAETLARAKERGVHIGRYAERLLEGPLPWARMRQARALLSLCDKYGDGRVEAVCQSALAFDVVSVARVASKLKQATELLVPPVVDRQAKVVPLPLPRFARPPSHFETCTPSTTKGGR